MLGRDAVDRGACHDRDPIRRGTESPIDDATVRAAHVLARSINDRDPLALASHCTERVEFDSQSLLEPIFGREQVERYVATELALADSDRKGLKAVLGVIDAERNDQAGVILYEHGAPRAFWAPSVTASGEIERIFGYTLVPPPQTARRLEAPPEPPARDDRGAEFRAAEGPIRFHGFAASRAAAQRWLAPKLAELERRFTGSESRVHIHEGITSEDAIRAATRERRHFGLVSYPAICVERSGVVYRDGSAVQSLEAITADVRALLGARSD